MSTTKKIHEVEQKSKEWHELRAEFPFTASNFNAIKTMGAGLDSLIRKKLAEKYSIADRKELRNEHIDRGNELEPDARSLYELTYDVEVKEIGFITDSSICDMAGVSIDGDVVGTDGLLEIKCYNDEKYIEALRELKKKGSIKIENKHYDQMQGQMLFHGKLWNDYMIFNPNYKKDMIVQRVYADMETFTAIVQGLIEAKKRYLSFEDDLKDYNL